MAHARERNKMAYAIIRGKSGRRHEADSGPHRSASKFMLAKRQSRYILRPILTRFRSTYGALQL